VQISIEQYLCVKKEDRLEDFEVALLLDDFSQENFTISEGALKKLYVEALTNVNKDSKFLRTALTIEKLTKDCTAFKKIRAMVGSPVRRYWGMHKLKVM
jgi:hypothetical protein